MKNLRKRKRKSSERICPPRSAVPGRFLNFLPHGHRTNFTSDFALTQAWISFVDNHNQRHQHTHSKAFAPTTKGICLHNARHLPPKFTHLMAFAHQDPAWHGGLLTLYSMITPNTSTHALKGICPHNQRHLPPQRKVFASQIHALNGICPPRPGVTWRGFNSLLHDHTKHIYPRTQRHSPPQPKAFAPTTKGIWLHNARYLPPEFTHLMAFARQDPAWHGGFSTFYSKSMITPNTSTHALKGICPHNQRHLPPQRKVFASQIHASNGICPPRPGVTWRFFKNLLHYHTRNRVQWVFPFSRTNYSSDFALTLTWISWVADHTAS